MGAYLNSERLVIHLSIKSDVIILSVTEIAMTNQEFCDVVILKEISQDWIFVRVIKK